MVYLSAAGEKIQRKAGPCLGPPPGLLFLLRGSRSSTGLCPPAPTSLRWALIKSNQSSQCQWAFHYLPDKYMKKQLSRQLLLQPQILGVLRAWSWPGCPWPPSPQQITDQYHEQRRVIRGSVCIYAGAVKDRASYTVQTQPRKKCNCFGQSPSVPPVSSVLDSRWTQQQAGKEQKTLGNELSKSHIRSKKKKKNQLSLLLHFRKCYLPTKQPKGQLKRMSSTPAGWIEPLQGLDRKQMLLFVILKPLWLL